MKSFFSNNLTKIFIIFLFSRIFLTVFDLAIENTDTKDGLPLSSIQTAYEPWIQWDAGWYNSIATDWYKHNPDSYQQNYAFFPLFPFFMKAAGPLVGNNFLLAGVLISNIFFLMGIYIFYRFIKEFYNEKLAYYSSLALMIFPVSFIFSTAMSESTFFLFMMLTIYLSRKNKFFLASLAGMMLALTRSLGFIILIVVLYDYLKSIDFNVRKLNFKILYLALIPAGTAAFALYIANMTGHLTSILSIQSKWERSFTEPITTLINYIFTNDIKVMIATTFFVSLVLLVISQFKKIEIHYWIFALLILMVPVLNSPNSFHMLSLPRYAVVAFPIYIIIGRFIESRNFLREGYLALSPILLLGFFLAWSMGIGIVI